MITNSPTLFEHPTLALSSLSIAEPVVILHLTNADQSEVLRFLAERPLPNMIMSGYLRDHGIQSQYHRGTFYGCRDGAGTLIGVALIGHAVLMDARSEAALREFAQLAQQYPRTHMLMGEAELIGRFWNYYYAPGGHAGNRACREVLFELNEPPPHADYVRRLRLADATDLDRVVPVHAALAFAESGVDPLQVDSPGFHERALRRIKESRTWVLVDHDQLIFKAEIVSDTPEGIYLEGVYVHPDHRGMGHGTRCLAQMTRRLLGRTNSISLLVNEERRQAQNFYRKLGFVSRGFYDTIFLRTRTWPAPGHDQYFSRETS